MKNINAKGYIAQIYDRNKRLADWYFSSGMHQWIELYVYDDELGKTQYVETEFEDLPRMLEQFGFRCVIDEVVTTVPMFFGGKNDGQDA